MDSGTFKHRAMWRSWTFWDPRMLGGLVMYNRRLRTVPPWTSVTTALIGRILSYSPWVIFTTRPPQPIE